MKNFMAGAFGSSLAFMIFMVSPYGPFDWQFWAAFLPIASIGGIYANVKNK